MLTIIVVTFLYFLVAGIAALLTYVEQRNTGDRNMMLTTLGFTACAVWPLTVLTVAVAVAVAARAGATQG